MDYRCPIPLEIYICLNLFAGGHEDKPNGEDQATECSKVIPL